MANGNFCRSEFSSSGHIYGHCHVPQILFLAQWLHIWPMEIFADRRFCPVTVYMALPISPDRCFCPVAIDMAIFRRSDCFAQWPYIWPLPLSANRIFRSVAIYVATATFRQSNFSLSGNICGHCYFPRIEVFAQWPYMWPLPHLAMRNFAH
jgi:hypothetical protein